MLRHHGGDADARRLDGEDLVDGRVGEQTLELLAHLVEQVDVHLVVQKAVHLQNAFRLHHTVAPDALFKQFHCLVPLPIPTYTMRLVLNGNRSRDQQADRHDGRDEDDGGDHTIERVIQERLATLLLALDI